MLQRLASSAVVAACFAAIVVVGVLLVDGWWLS